MAENTQSFEHKQISFWKFLHNREEDTVLGRTGKSWALICGFYTVFYLFLAGFFALMMAVFYQTLDVKVNPTYTPGDQNSLLVHPGLSLRPLPRIMNTRIIHIAYEHNSPKSVQYWVNGLNDFIEPYEVPTEPPLVECTEDSPPLEGEVCTFTSAALGPICSRDQDWGYMNYSPCVLLKMNRMIGWKPKVYKTLKELPIDMPSDLKDHINMTYTEQGAIPEMIWVSCTVKNPDYNGTLNYSPSRGFPAYYFPYRNTDGYRSPLVAVELSQTQPSETIEIECKAWAKNIPHKRRDRFGLVQFEFVIVDLDQPLT